MEVARQTSAEEAAMEFAAAAYLDVVPEASRMAKSSVCSQMRLIDDLLGLNEFGMEKFACNVLKVVRSLLGNNWVSGSAVRDFLRAERALSNIKFLRNLLAFACQVQKVRTIGLTKVKIYFLSPIRW